MRKFTIMVFIIVFLCVFSRESMAGKNTLSLGGGIVFSPEYSDLLNDTYPDDNMYGGWFNVNLLLQREIIKGVTLGPKIDLLTDFVFGDFVNLIILSGVAGRLTLQSAPSVYLQVEMDYGYSHSGSSRFDFESETFAFGGTIGCIFNKGWQVEVGYLEIPVDAKLQKNSEVRKNVNLGGVLLRIGKSF